MYLGLGSSPAELLCPQRSALSDRDGDRELEEAEEARGAPPVIVNSAYNNVVGLHASVSPGQYARFQRTSPQFVLADTKFAYQSVKRRSEREGSIVLSSLHFTCSVRPDSVEVSARSQRGRGVDGCHMLCMSGSVLVGFCVLGTRWDGMALLKSNVSWGSARY